MNKNCDSFKHSISEEKDNQESYQEMENISNTQTQVQELLANNYYTDVRIESEDRVMF